MNQAHQTGQEQTAEDDREDHEPGGLPAAGRIARVQQGGGQHGETRDQLARPEGMPEFTTWHG
ncbi:hypothetical protein HRW23_04595 [Streptomyces lunaelactis]|uniref:hypothetical protein n=1 Tax=Streptomyces lunaelactis TaxID=1535768 RepID=UPI0015854A33|nr:hypothetical protein [Streptomyces lunaelactis]NUK72501.1 hypothetical protein [Streptomyces lunaelactis]NUK76696.1 hypothetical protein [Streptomyces lunaelactis]